MVCIIHLHAHTSWMWSKGRSLPTLPWGDCCNVRGMGNAINKVFPCWKKCAIC